MSVDYAGIERFKADIREWGEEKLPLLALYVSKAFLGDAAVMLVNGTRVKTGHTRYQYQLSYFGTAAQEIPGVDPGGEQTISRLMEQIDSLQTFQNASIVLPVVWGAKLEELDHMFAQTYASLIAMAQEIGARGIEKYKAENV